jgi:hypothetical protein
MTRKTLENIRDTQHDVQQIENHVNKLVGPIPSGQDRGDRHYFDPDYGEHIATDTWTNGLHDERTIKVDDSSHAMSFDTIKR